MEEFIELLFDNEDIMKSRIEDDIIPKNANLIKVRGEKKKKVKVQQDAVKAEPATPKVLVYEGEINPLEDTRSFMKYYRIFLEYCLGQKVTFDGYSYDSVFATDILDLMIISGKNNMSFLNAWLKWYCDTKLKGIRVQRVKYTSMKAFKDTFVVFADSYFVSH